MKEDLSDFFSKQSTKVKAKIRALAVKKAEENCIRYGKRIEDIPLDEWKRIVAEEEEELIKRAWKFGGIGAVAFGFMPWW
jgi:hypothetical protein